MPGAVLGGRYRLERIIGTGGMAVVWSAEDARLARRVAVKVISDALADDAVYVERFAQEARTAAGITHANLVPIYDFSARESRPYLVMELVEGGTLNRRLERGPLRSEQVRGLACDLLSALACIHRAGVVHRDIKPDNVLCGDDGRARLTDFGIARPTAGSDLTAPGHTVGTLGYLAPELLEGGEPSPQSDLYSLGVLLQRIPLVGRSDPVVDYLVARLTLPRPDQRPRDAGSALRQLRYARDPGQATQSFEVIREPLPAVRGPRPSLRFRPTLALIALLAALVVIGFSLGESSQSVAARATSVQARRAAAVHAIRPGRLSELEARLHRLAATLASSAR